MTCSNWGGTVCCRNCCGLWTIWKMFSFSKIALRRCSTQLFRTKKDENISTAFPCSKHWQPMHSEVVRLRTILSTIWLLLWRNWVLVRFIVTSSGNGVRSTKAFSHHENKEAAAKKVKDKRYSSWYILKWRRIPIIRHFSDVLFLSDCYLLFDNRSIEKIRLSRHP